MVTKLNHFTVKFYDPLTVFDTISQCIMRSFPAAWTTAIRCSLESRKDWWTGCSRFRTPLSVWFRYSTLRPFIAGAPSATLAISAPARPLQDGHVRSPVVVWRFAIVPGRRLPSCRRCSWLVSGGCVPQPNMRRDADAQHLWRQSVLCCWTWTVEQSSITPERHWLIVQWIPAVVKDISVWTVGPRRSVNFINCAD